jgi:hypothetical protein
VPDNWSVTKEDATHSVSVSETTVETAEFRKGGPTLAGSYAFEEFLAATRDGNFERNQIKLRFGDAALEAILALVRERLARLKTREAAAPPPEPGRIDACAVCSSLADKVTADLTKAEKLPLAADALVKLRPQSGSTTFGDLRRCPGCGTYYVYTYSYQSELFTEGQEDASLERLTPLDALVHLKKYSAEERRAYAERYDAAMRNLRGILAKRRSRFLAYAARAIAQDHMRRREWSEAARMVSDRRREVRVGLAHVVRELDPHDKAAMAIFPAFLKLLADQGIEWQMMWELEDLARRGLDPVRAIPLIIQNAGSYWTWNMLGPWVERLSRSRKRGVPDIPLDACIPRLVAAVKTHDAHKSGARAGIFAVLALMARKPARARRIRKELESRKAASGELGQRLMTLLAGHGKQTWY